MTFVHKPDDEVRAMSNEEFRKYLVAAAAEDMKPGGAFERFIAHTKANPPKYPDGPVEAIVFFSPKSSSTDGS